MITPYETYNNKIGVKLSFLLVDEKIKHPESLSVLSYSAYEKRATRTPLFKLRTGGGKGNDVLLNWQYLEPTWKYALKTTFGDPVVEHNPMEEYFEMDEKARSYYDGYTCADGGHLTPQQISAATINASVLQAFLKLKHNREVTHKRLGNSSRGLWPGLLNDLNGFKNILKVKYEGITHTLPESERRIREDLKGWKELSYEYYVDGRSRNQNAKKVVTEKHLAMLEALLTKHNNFDNEQISNFYNIAAVALGWKTIDASTVANYRNKLGLFITSGNSGETNFRNTKSMQVKRSRASVATAFWTLDGWDVELFYQREETNKKGHKVITYHNRLTVVVVLDTVAGIRYPIGYAISSHETPELIAQALRNAANHTAELFGDRYKPHQLQSDHYAISTLTPIYEKMSEHFTPARVKNSKAKIIEPYFKHLNKTCQTNFKNWSGFGVTGRKENQPNEDYLNKIRHSFPDENGCREQIVRLMEMERSAKIDRYTERWNALPEADRLLLSTEEYLQLFGTVHSHTNKLKGDGFTPTLFGEKRVYDSFDTKFRELGYMDWAVKYDPADLSTVLVVNATSDANSKLTKVIGTHRFLLTEKDIQPEALYDRQDGDAAKLQKVFGFNKQLEASVMERMSDTQNILEEVFAESPQLNNSLTKMVLCDSNGQHKDQRNSQRYIPKNKTIDVSTSLNMTESAEEIIEDDIRNNY